MRERLTLAGQAFGKLAAAILARSPGPPFAADRHVNEPRPMTGMQHRHQMAALRAALVLSGRDSLRRSRTLLRKAA